MFPRINPTKTTAWLQLQQHSQSMRMARIRSLFQEDPTRFDTFSVTAGDFLFDFSKNIITRETRALLIQLARECQLELAMKAFFEGERINVTENRPVLHTALRNFSDQDLPIDGHDILADVRKVQMQMRSFCESIHAGKWRGYSGKPIRQIVNIGIGGSDLGPLMVTEALRPYWKKNIEPHFVSNVDGTHITETLKKIDPETTLFLIASKTFTTQETMTNAHTARKWFLQHGGNEESIAKHFVALSTNEKEVVKFGIDPQNMFVFWDWVGGRYSLWSAIGLSIALTIGYNHFEELLQGAHAADLHFRNTKLEENIPVLMALYGLWYTNFFGAQSEAILPYDQYLHRFAAYFQQGNMESNGKNKDRSGEQVTYATGPVIWGEPGTNGQHAFYQLIHQGTVMIPCDFIAPAISQNPTGDHHEKLLSNFFAQTEALMNGKDEHTVINECKTAGYPEEVYRPLVPFKLFHGNKPSNSILIKKITPYNLGSLIAYYEHKIFVQGVIWNIYSFDQWGVELGKQLANTILPELQNDEKISSHDPSTNGLINAYKRLR